MNILGVTTIAIAVYKVLKEICLNKDLEGIDSSKIFIDYLLEDKGQEYKTIKSIVTRRIETIIKDCKRFKIGKTGYPDQRISNYSNYSAMYLLCHSDDRATIEVLEAYYNQKYCEHQRCDNQRVGSAGIMTNKYNDYYLYIVVD